MALTSWPAARAINLLPRDDEELERLHQVLGERLFAGVIVKNLSEAAAVERARAWSARGVSVSVGMGDGDDSQWRRALDVAGASVARHVNQPWFASGHAVGALRAHGRHTLVNALISPADAQFGRVALSAGGDAVLLPWDRLLANLNELGVDSIKFFPMQGEKGHGAYTALLGRLARAGAGIAVEPSGGIAPGHLDWLYGEGDAAGVAVIPHIYGALRRPDGEIDRLALDTIAAAVAAPLA